MEISDEKVQDWILQAVQSGKQETSGLVSDLKEVILTAVRDEVKITVNGKIDRMQKHLEGQDKILGEIKDEQKRLKTDTDPIINIKNVTWNFIKGVLWMAGAIFAIGSAYLVIIQILKL